MKLTTIAFIALLGSVLLFTGCDKDKKDDKSSSASEVVRFKWSQKNTEAQAQITVINQYGEAVAGAQVLIGDSQGSPFRDNFVTSDGSGVARIPVEWVSPASVTVDAKGYIRQTLMNQFPGNITLRLNSAYLAQRAEVKGLVTGLPVVDGDKLIDFALVMPALTKADLLNFDLGQVISPYTDTFSAAGQTGDVPSNVSIPKQKESYFIGVTLDKPIYRLKVATLGPKKFVAARGRFVFKTVVSELRAGKPFQDLINHFSILGGSLRDATVTGPLTNLDIPGTEMSFSSVIQVNSPAMPADELLMVLATSDVAGVMVPTDVKRVVAGKATALQTLPAKTGYVISVAKKQADFNSTAPGTDRMSASFLPVANSAQKLLPIAGNPSITNSGGYVINLPAAPAAEGVNALAVSASLSDLVEVKDGAKTVITTVRKWDILGSGWSQQLTLPKWPLETTPNRKRVEVNFIGSSTSKSTNIDDSLIENATHVSHASADF